ncbi:U11/U12 small nuclear ribonucleoprotein 59 kDa protein [Coffea arabica]|uniref:U11/U12 small nuclear ribonucleoprotein 59 kDa protein n=1 Tax=Coffea arabica TaxID=13443 RepID=A0A6P6SXX2_COFAR|nr:U11/U12 small nuclear ribonucleoprotein 59 kDa protein-like [Coffea arabica]XP_027070669.1 U11/U12 small nuclear ribonucleoprotein 59 kDa protein-like [Coffea arabica]XP_027070670.1 U11/U12 small nuclear ribonucleoprotein 59 kDa protein-like [Coffea arabica]
MNPMIPGPFNPTAPPNWAPVLPPFPPPSSAFWKSSNVRDCLKDLHDTVNLAKALGKELEMLIMMKNEEESSEGDSSIDRFHKLMEENRFDLDSQEMIALEAANALTSRLRVQLEPFRVVADVKAPWEEKSAAVKLSDKLRKYKRNKRWRKRKRMQVAENLAKEREQFDRIDKEADEWRAGEIAKEIAKRKVEKLKEIAKLKAKEEKKTLESELELMLIVEKLQELRSLRIQKLKKQGHFLPEEDDKFLERVRAAVEEEERQAMAAADTEAAKDAIATAEESRIQNRGPDSEKPSNNNKTVDMMVESEDRRDSTVVTGNASRPSGTEGQSSTVAYDSMANLPMEFYHYYYGSKTDMGTLIEVRRTWDAYIRPGGSRIPGHWVQPPPPSDETWASYLVKPK